MGTVPENVRMKLDWARHHMGEATRATNSFISTTPYVLTRQLEDGGAKHVYVFAKYTEPPPEIGLHVGDCIHNLRSSLDHLAVALAHKGARDRVSTLTEKQERRIQFPIVKCQDDWDNAITQHSLRYVPEAALQEILLLQPFCRRGAQYDADFLWRIGQLDNADKHRKLISAATVVHMECALPPNVPDPKEVQVQRTWALGGAVAAWVYPTPQPDLDAWRPSFSVAVDDAWPPTWAVEKLLSDYINYVETHVVPHLLHNL